MRSRLDDDEGLEDLPDVDGLDDVLKRRQPESRRWTDPGLRTYRPCAAHDAPVADYHSVALLDVGQFGHLKMLLSLLDRTERSEKPVREIVEWLNNWLPIEGYEFRAGLHGVLSTNIGRANIGRQLNLLCNCTF